jgi:hypothetical protein
VGDFAERKIIATGARVRANGEFRLPQSKSRKTARRFALRNDGRKNGGRPQYYFIIFEIVFESLASRGVWFCSRFWASRL